MYIIWIVRVHTFTEGDVAGFVDNSFPSVDIAPGSVNAPVRVAAVVTRLFCRSIPCSHHHIHRIPPDTRLFRCACVHITCVFFPKIGHSAWWSWQNFPWYQIWKDNILSFLNWNVKHSFELEAQLTWAQGYIAVVPSYILVSCVAPCTIWFTIGVSTEVSSCLKSFIRKVIRIIPSMTVRCLHVPPLAG